jgi:hypothetical protein
MKGVAILASFEITEVHTESSSAGGAYHEHIAKVKTKGGSEWSRATVVKDIRYGNDSYYTYGGGEYADVIVRECPHCDFGDYITTTPDSTTKNNLLDLPRF